MIYPKTYKENLLWRNQLTARCKVDPEFRAKVREMFFRDPLFAFNGFFWTLDVRKRPQHHQPFCTYKFQDDMITRMVTHIANGRDLVVEKSRDMGASWCVIGVLTWLWLNPEGGADFLVGSRIEDYVDKKGDMRTLLQKARYLIYRLPRWLLPKGFAPGKGQKYNKNDNFMRLINPDSGSTIIGESNNPNFSTGGRFAAIFFDEFAKWESTDDSAWMAAGDASPCRLAVSTAFGAGGQFYKLATDGRTDKVRLHWSLHPEKGAGKYCVWPMDPELQEVELRSPWFDSECERRSAVEIAQELEMDYIGAGVPVFDGKAGKRMRFLLKAEKRPENYYDVDAFTGKVTAIARPRFDEGYMTVWAKPDRTHQYSLGVDVAEGKEDGDYSAVKVLDRELKTVVASYVSRIDEVRLGRIICGIADYYNRGWIGIETNGPGLATFDICSMDPITPNLFMMPSFDSASNTVSHMKGWRTTRSSKNILIAGIKEWLIEGKGWADQRCVGEMTTYVRDRNGKANAKEGCHDDEVIALGIAIQVDVLAPYEGYEKPVERGEHNLPLTLFNPQRIREPMTIEERCLATLENKKEWEVGNFDPWAANDYAQTGAIWLGELF